MCIDKLWLVVEMEHHVQLMEGKTYRITFVPIPIRNNVHQEPPMKGKVEGMDGANVKMIDGDGDVHVIPMKYILRAELVNVGGRRRKASRKIRRKTHRKSRCVYRN